jgi:uncharacterized coiled-coil DUF342 family protein
METLSLPLEQGRQIVQHLSELEDQLDKCLVRWRAHQLKTDDETDIPSGEVFWSYMPDEEELEFREKILEVAELSDQVKEQVEQGHVEKQLLLKLNEKLGDLQTKYGNILVFSATVAAIISGLKDLIQIFVGQ